MSTLVLPAPIAPRAPLTTSTCPAEITSSKSTLRESLSRTRFIDGELSRRASLLTGASSFAVVVPRASASWAESSPVNKSRQ